MVETSIVGWIVLACFGIILLGALVDQAGYYTDSSKNTVINETFTPTANNTCVGLNRGPIVSVQAVYGDNCEYENTHYTVCAGTGIQVHTNGTGACPTMNLTGGAKKVSYTFYKPTGMGGVIVGLMVAVFLLAVILIYLGLV